MPGPRSGAGGARRDAVAVLVTFAVLGVVGGVLWPLLLTPAEFTKVRGGGSMAENDLGRQFSADGWYVVIAVLAAVLAAAVLTFWRRRDPLLTVVLMLLGSGVAAFVMSAVGGLLGPGDPTAALRAAGVGDRVPEQLGVDAFVVYLAWPFGTMVGALVVLLGHEPTSEPTPAEEDPPSLGTTPADAGAAG